MLVGHFDEPYLKYALDSVKWVDQMVVVLNGNSIPNTVELLKWFEDHPEIPSVKIIHYEKYYNNFNFAKARQLAKDATDADLILKIDADEVYYDSFQETVKNLHIQKKFVDMYGAPEPIDVYVTQFYHMMGDIKHYQFIQQQETLFWNSPEIKWQCDVHEKLTKPGDIVYCTIPDMFMHLGYIKPPEEVFRRWQLYAELEGIEGAYENTNPKTILDDRPRTPFTGEYPEALKPLLEEE